MQPWLWATAWLWEGVCEVVERQKYKHLIMRSSQEDVSAALEFLQPRCLGERTVMEKILPATLPAGAENDQRSVRRLHLQKPKRTHRYVFTFCAARVPYTTSWSRSSDPCAAHAVHQAGWWVWHTCRGTQASVLMSGAAAPSSAALLLMVLFERGTSKKSVQRLPAIG